MSIYTRKQIHVPVEMNEVVYVNVPRLELPARRVVTEIRIALNGIFITLTNSRTCESEVYMAADVNKKFFIYSHEAEFFAREEKLHAQR